MQTIVERPGHTCEPGTPHICGGCAYDAGYAAGMKAMQAKVDSWFQIPRYICPHVQYPTLTGEPPALTAQELVQKMGPRLRP